MNIVITGCAAGIGRALAEEFHGRGHTIYATDRDTGPLAELEAKGIRTAPLDVTSQEDINALVNRLNADGTDVDMLINNAGFGAMGPMAELPLGTLRAQFEVNVFSIVALAQALIPGMVARGNGRIVNVSSISGVMATPFAGAYCSSKAAVNSLSDSMRMELAPFGVKVITVQPGGIRSSFGDTASKGASWLGPDSLYAPVSDAIEARAQGGQENAMSAEDFAKRMADAVLAKSPKSVVRIGEKSTRMPLAKKLLPDSFVDRTLSKVFQLEKLGKR